MKLSKNGFYKEIFKLALPISAQYLISQVLQLVDNVMVGSLGEACISAVSICFTFSWLVMTFIMGFSSGASVLSAQAYGRKDIKQLKKLSAAALRINIFISLFFFVLSALFPSQILSLYTNQADVIEKGVEYLSVIKYMFPFYAINQTLVSMLQAAKNVKIGFYNTTISCLVNAVFNYFLIYGNFGFPKLGVQGAAIATLISRIVEMAIVSFYIAYFEKKIGFAAKDVFKRSDFALLKELTVVALPILAIEVLGNLVSSVQTSITGHVSGNYIAANSIVHTAWVIPSTLGFGISIAAGVMVGNAIGEGDENKIKGCAQQFTVFSIVFGIFNSAVLMLILPLIMGLYNVSSETLELANKMGRFALITVFFISINSILCYGVIKATGETRKLLIMDIISNWGIAIPLGYICAFIIKVPVHYLYLILRSGNIYKGLWGICKLRTKNWYQIKGGNENELSKTVS